MMKRLLSLIFALALVLTGCGSRTDSEKSVVSAQSTPVSVQSLAEADAEIPPYFTVEYKEAGAAVGNAREMIWHEGRFLCSKSAGQNDYYARSLYWAEPYGAKAQTILTMTGDDVINCFCLGGDGNVYAVVSRVLEDALENPEGFCLDGYEDSRLMALDSEGTLLSETPLEQEGNTSYSSLAVDSEGNCYVDRNEFDETSGFFSKSFLDRRSPSGTVTTLSLKEALNDDSATLAGFLTAQNGDILLNIQQNEWPMVYTLHTEPLAIGEKCFERISEMQWPTLYSGDFSDFYVLDDKTGLTTYGLNGATHSYFKLSELPSTVPEYARFLAETAENQFLFRCGINGVQYFIEINGAWEKPPESEKIQLTLGTSTEYIGGGDLPELVVAFNILNPDYELVLKDYSQDNSIYEKDQLMEQLNQDILDGNGPDLLVLGEYSFPCSTYAGNGYLMDLNPLIDGDEEFDRTEYLQNIWSVCENGGKLYGITPSFTVTTMMTSSDYMPKTEGWTPTECKAIAQSSEIPLMEGKWIGLSYEDWAISRYLLGNGLSGYIHGDTCDFTSGEFAALLELLGADYPEQPEAETVEESLWVKNGQVLTEYTGVPWPEQLNYIKWKYGAHCVYTGFPTPDKKQLAIETTGSIGVSAKTEHPEAAWQFIKMLLEAPSTRLIGEFTSKKSALEEAIRRTTLPEGDPEAYDLHTSVGVEDDMVDLTLELLTEEEAAYFLKLLEETDCSMVDAETQAIVREEAASYFSGDTSAEQVAEIVQNRVQLHLWEQS